MSSMLWRLILNIAFRISITMNVWIMQYMLAREDNAYSCDDDEDEDNEAEDENDDEPDDEDNDDNDKDDDETK